MSEWKAPGLWGVDRGTEAGYRADEFALLKGIKRAAELAGGA